MGVIRKRPARAVHDYRTTHFRRHLGKARLVTGASLLCTPEMTRPHLDKLTNFAPDRVVVFTYAKSLAWLAILTAVIVGIQNIVELVLIDFIHGNPHRTQGNAIFMMIVYTPLLGLGALVGVLLVLTMPQCFQATISSALGCRLGSRAQAGVWVALPVTAALT